MDASQLLKGVLPTAILATIAGGEDHGYSILKALRAAGFSRVGDASVYGALQRLFADGLLATHLEPSERGPARKCYTLTAAGHQNLLEGRRDWSAFKSAIDGLLQDERSEIRS